MMGPIMEKSLSVNVLCFLKRYNINAAVLMKMCVHSDNTVLLTILNQLNVPFLHHKSYRCVVPFFGQWHNKWTCIGLF